MTDTKPCSDLAGLDEHGLPFNTDSEAVDEMGTALQRWQSDGGDDAISRSTRVTSAA